MSNSLYVCSVNFIHFWVSFIPYLLFIQFFLLRGTRIIFTLTSTLWCLITFAFNYSRYTQVLVAYAVIGNDCQKQKGEKIVRGIRFFMRLFSTDMTRSDQIGSSWSQKWTQKAAQSLKRVISKFFSSPCEWVRTQNQREVELEWKWKCFWNS